MVLRSPLASTLTCLIVWLSAAAIVAQPNRAVRQVQEMLLLDVDNAATKKFSTVQTHLRVGQVKEAVELLRSISDVHAGKLVAAGDGRYVNVQIYSQMLAAGLSSDGLKIYRAELDPVLKPTFEAARNATDETQLRKILQQGYCCSFADEALLILGDLAWDAGDVWRARSYWEQLLPPMPPKQPGDPVAWLAYPDSDLAQPLILGRLVLCSIHSGQRVTAQRELAEFGRRHPLAEGMLAGKTGNLLEILKGVLQESESWREPVQTSGVETFAGNAQRFQLEPQAIELGRLRWRASLKPFGDEPRRGFQRAFLGSPCYFPVVYGDVVFVNDDEQILAYRLQNGKPAWSDAPADARIYACGADHQERGNLPREFNEALVGNLGWPRFTMTVADGRLYARMGSVRPFSGDRGGLLTCLDLAHGEGKLVWETFASAVEPNIGGWIFEGSPVVKGGRVYVGLRRIHPQPQANVACFDAANGKLIWNRKLCVGQTNPNFPEFDINQHLLTWGDGTLYYTTHLGAVAALDPRQGTIKWIVSYPRAEDTRVRHEMVNRLQRGPLPAMFVNGMLYTAPIDSDELLAIDAETGLLKWRRSLDSPIHALLGVAKGQVFVSGPELWAISVDTGHVTWKVGDPDPESHGFGRGLLADDVIYWPTHEEIYLIEQETGALRRRIPLFDIHGQSGGNLTLTNGHLLVSQPHGLAVFSDRGPPPERSRPSKPEYTRKSSPAREPWDAARRQFEDRNWGTAADQFQQVRQLAQPDDEWMVRPLSVVAGEYEIDCRLRQAWELTKSDPTTATTTLAQALQVANEVAAQAGFDRGAKADRASESSLAESHHWRFRLPSSLPAEMRTWIGEQIRGQAGRQHLMSGNDFVPPIQQVGGATDFQSRSLTWRDVTQTDDAAVSRQLIDAERLVTLRPRPSILTLRHLAARLPTAEERTRAWCGVARGLESEQSWGTALAAWKMAAHVAPSDAVITEHDQQLPLSDFIRERSEQPQFVREEQSRRNEFPPLLTRRWERSFRPDSRTVYPEGTAPAVDLNCVLIDQSPIACVNVADGTVRWQITLSHSLLWASYTAEYLVLGTEAEVRAVSVQTGETVWHRRLADTEQSSCHLSEMMTLEVVGPAVQFGRPSRDPPSANFGKFSQFAIVEATLLARIDDKCLLAWNALTGQPAWSFEVPRGLAPGWALTPKNVTVCQQSPASLVVLDCHAGVEVARRSIDAGPWISPPWARDDGSLLTVGQGGSIASWSKPGAAWETDEGPRAWFRPGSESQALTLPEVFSRGSISLLGTEGNTLTAVDSILGHTVWKTVLGTSPIFDMRSASCCDDQQVYVAADGILRAYDLRSGGLNWERQIGSASIRWQSAVRGTAVFAYPERSVKTGMESPVTICEAETGRYRQRLKLPANGGEVRVYLVGQMTLLACGTTLCGLGH